MRRNFRSPQMLTRRHSQWGLGGARVGMLVLTLIDPAHASAQSANSKPSLPQTQQPAQPVQASPEQTITVTGQRQNVLSSIDRTSYNIANDLQGATGSLADVLSNVPSIEVDPAGNVSLRGDPNVVILIDGQPSGMLRGPNRGAALQQLPAGEYERVEVIPTPSAAFGPEGSGGAINLIRKRVRPGGLSGSARLNGGSKGRVNGGVSGTYAVADTLVSGDLNARRDELDGSSERVRERLSPGAAFFSNARLVSDSLSKSQSGNLRIALEHRLNAATQFNVELNGSGNRSESDAVEIYDAEAGFEPARAAYVRTSDLASRTDNGEARSRLARTFGSNEHKATLDVSYQSSTASRTLKSYTAISSPLPSQVIEEFIFGSKQKLAQLKADYHRPIGETSNLQFGMDLEWQDNRYDNARAHGVAGGQLSPPPPLTHRFAHAQNVKAIYGTYEHALGELKLLGGARLEQVRLDLDQTTDGSRYVSDYVRLYPTGHLSYQLTDKEQLRASYSRRVQRPQGQDLDPYPEFRDPLNFRAGNPRLKPQETDSYEVAWQRRGGPNFYQLTLFHRSTRRAFTEVVQDTGGGILVTTRENLGKSRFLGLELVTNQRMSAALTLNASLNAAWNEIDPGNLGFSERRSAIQTGGRASLNWQATPRDTLQISGFMSGKSLRPQGYREASGMINAGYRHKINERISLVGTVRDVLGNFGEAIVIDTPTLRDRVERKFGGRIVFVGVNYRLGQSHASRREQNFDFEAGRAD